MALSFATIRFFAVIRQTMKARRLLSCPQKWVKPKNVKVSGFPSPRYFRSRAVNRPNSISRVLSACNSNPNFASRSRNSCVRVLLDTLHGAPVCADRQVDPPVRFHTPATPRRLFRGKLYAEARRSYRGVLRRLGGGAGLLTKA